MSIPTLPLHPFLHILLGELTPSKTPHCCCDTAASCVAPPRLICMIILGSSSLTSARVTTCFLEPSHHLTPHRDAVPDVRLTVVSWQRRNRINRKT
ncbi:hypothetical protein AVEN_144629-1 [Araneus ventricosus]|uniref:Uncharacterized protein n=1 Tax=Araneus ventricosus TaxID=182803 RepID=A0A4Y2C0D7_ARAVE|nr:hypothetical protein AVEN_144629-1 [Araneus ventricosus]